MTTNIDIVHPYASHESHDISKKITVEVSGFSNNGKIEGLCEIKFSYNGELEKNEDYIKLELQTEEAYLDG